MAKGENMEISWDIDAALIREADLLRQELTRRTDFAFEIGKLAFSESVLNRKEKTKKLLSEKDRTVHGSFTQFCWDSFSRHCLCEWGDVSPEQKDTNDQALKAGGQIFSMYTHARHPTICILTEADRSKTVVGLEEEVVEFEQD